MTEDVLDEVASLAELARWIEGPGWTGRLSSVGTDHEAHEALRVAIERLRTRLSPEHRAPGLQALKDRVLADPGADPATLAPLLGQIAELRATLPLAEHEQLFARIEADLAQRFPWAGGGVGRSDRARRAANLFCDYTGRSYLAGAEPDRHGNPVGGAYDLGPDGAYGGQTVHVLQMYAEQAFDFSLPTAALQRKGFAVHRRTTPGPVAELRAWLADARQLWLISGVSRQLEAGHVEVIRALWARGASLYLWGDNDPYFADANAVLAAIAGDGLAMAGNVAGGKVVDAFADGRGFRPHPVTTGLAHLFEGITVASIPEAVAAEHGFVELLRGSAGNLITVVRDAVPGGGVLMADGAFTRLYCNWDDAGSARYVSNAACFLAGHAARQAGEFTGGGALRGTCDWTRVDGLPWLVMTVGALSDPLINTDDRTLADPLSAGDRNCVVVDAVYAEAMGRWILGQPPERRTDPMTAVPVLGCLPLVDLGDPSNLRGFTDLLCACLMGGKDLPAEARLVWFSVLDRMLLRDDLRHPEVWRWLYRQALGAFRATPDLGDIGPELPLLDAFTAWASPATDEKLQARLSLESVGVIGRTLLREGRAPQERVERLARRALIVDLVREGGAPHDERRARFERELPVGPLLPPEARAALAAAVPAAAGSPWDVVAQIRRDSPIFRAAWG